jgi:hypothetical protein
MLYELKSQKIQIALNNGTESDRHQPRVAPTITIFQSCALDILPYLSIYTSLMLDWKAWTKNTSVGGACLFSESIST